LAAYRSALERVATALDLPGTPSLLTDIPEAVEAMAAKRGGLEGAGLERYVNPGLGPVLGRYSEGVES
jgi:hypothetical protein